MEGLEMTLDPTLDAMAAARRRVSADFGATVPEWFLHELNVVVTELIANSVEHGPGKPITLRLSRDEEGIIRGEVEDQGRGEVAMREIALPGERGLGLHIVDYLTTRWGVYEGSTHVWFEKPPWPDRRRGAGPKLGRSPG
jgi:anti-sigma regulatory factor (Ser/Thr protein kinase)